VDEFVKQDAEAPNVQGVVVGRVGQHLRRHVLQRPAEGVPLFVAAGFDAPAEVANLEDVVVAHEQVLGLDVPVDEAVLVQEVEPRAHLDEKVEGFVLCKRFFVPN